MVCQSSPYYFKFFKGCLPQIVLRLFLNSLTKYCSGISNKCNPHQRILKVDTMKGKLLIWVWCCLFSCHILNFIQKGYLNGYTKRRCTKYKLLLTSIFSTSPFSITIWVFVILTKKMSFRNYIQRGIFGLQIALRSLIDDF